MAEKEEEKQRVITPESLLADMEEMERFNGTTEAKIVENWYELKKRVVQVIIEKQKAAKKE